MLGLLKMEVHELSLGSPKTSKGLHAAVIMPFAITNDEVDDRGFVNDAFLEVYPSS